MSFRRFTGALRLSMPATVAAALVSAALAAYGGALIVVTHDRRLAEALSIDQVLDVRTLHCP